MRRRLSCKAYNFNVKNLLPFLPYIFSSCVNVERGSCKKTNREKSAISAVGISCPNKIMSASTAVTSFFLSKSMFIRLRTVPQTFQELNDLGVEVILTLINVR